MFFHHYFFPRVINFAFPEYKDYQQRVIDRVNDPQGPHGIIAYHSMGSGKTLTSLGAMERALRENPGKRGLFVVPASLVDNVYKEMKKHGFKGMKNWVDVMSYEKAANNYEKLARNGYAMTVFDEAHRLRNTGTKRAQRMRQVADSSGKVLMLTGTAGYNHPVDVANLINMINPDERLPNSGKDFEQAFINDKTWQFTSAADYGLAPALNKYIDKYDRPADSADYPSVTRTVVPVQMSPEQANMYKVVERSIPAEIRRKLKNNLPLSLQESRALNVFSTGVRQVSDSMMHHDMTASYDTSPKILTAAQHMADAAAKGPGFRGLVYSNYIDAGINPYVQAMQARGISPMVFTGSLSKKEKKRLIDEYNSDSPDPKVLAVSSSGAEGLDLRNTRMMQILEPHFNTAKLNQVEARAIRYKSHDSLPPDQRKVAVEEYHSVYPPTRFQSMFGFAPDTAIDDYLSGLAERKQLMINQMEGYMRNQPPSKRRWF